MTPAVVYRHISSGGALLYIGSTLLVPERNAHHRVYSPWFLPDVRTEWTAFGCLELAKEGEAEAIRLECPRWNIQHRAKDHPDGSVRTYWEVAQMYPGTYREHLITTPKPWFLEHKTRAVPA